MGELPVQVVPIGNREAYPELADPRGPARGGEPCRICGDPIPATAHPAHKARHVCSPEHNAALKRRLKRAEARRSRESVSPASTPADDAVGLPSLAGILSTESRPPRVFRTRAGVDFPFEFGRDCPILGDVVERDGLHTQYAQVDLNFDGILAEKVIVAYNRESGSLLVLGCSPEAGVSPYTYWTELHHRVFFQDREETGALREPFEHGGKRCVWYREIIRDLDEAGNAYSWMATVCASEVRPTLWAPKFRKRSERYERTTKAANAAAARARECGITIHVDRVDPYDIFERDGWICRLCGSPVDRTKRHPEDDSPSLDHVHPISRGGDHIARNLQTSHLRCNIAKGDRTVPALPEASGKS